MNSYIPSRSIGDSPSDCENSRLLYEYEGHLDFPTMNSIVSNVKRLLKIEQLPRSVFNKVYGVTVESLENSFRCQFALLDGLKNWEMMRCAFKLFYDDHGFYVFSSRPITSSDKENLDKRLDLILGKSRDELREWYKERLFGDNSPKSTIGQLGIIDIALRSSRLEYRIVSNQSKNLVLQLESFIALG